MPTSPSEKWGEHRERSVAVSAPTTDPGGRLRSLALSEAACCRRLRSSATGRARRFGWRGSGTAAEGAVQTLCVATASASWSVARRQPAQLLLALLLAAAVVAAVVEDVTRQRSSWPSSQHQRRARFRQRVSLRAGRRGSPFADPARLLWSVDGGTSEVDVVELVPAMSCDSPRRHRARRHATPAGERLRV